MSQRLEIDLETERVQLDGLWVTREELSARIQQMLAAGDYRISRLSDALEQLAQTMAGARTLHLRLTNEQYAKLEAAGNKLGKSASAFARDLLMQVLGGAAAPAPAAAAPTATAPTAAAAPVPLPAPTPTSVPPVVAPAPVAAAGAASQALAASADVTPEEAAQALTIAPKRREPAAGAPHGAPPVMTPVAAPHAAPPAIATPAAGTPSVVVDLGDESKKAPGADGRRWFNRT